MKKLISIFCCFFVIFLLFGCSKKESYVPVENLEHRVSSELEEIDNIQNLSDETIKALSVVIRTNLLNDNQNNKNISENKEYSTVHNHIYDIIKETSGEVLKSSEGLKKFEIEESYSNGLWEIQIKKSDLLNYLNKNNISLSNISNITPVFDEDNNFLYLVVGGKVIYYNELKDEFGLKSKKITNIENNINSITIYGEGYDSDTAYFNIEESLQLEEDGLNYKELLNHFFKGFNLKTM